VKKFVLLAVLVAIVVAAAQKLKGASN